MPIDLAPGPALSRRRMLAAGLAIGGATALLPRRRNAGSDGHASGWYALLSDPHIAAEPAQRLRGECMADNLRAVAADILRADDPPRGVIVGGDLAFKTGERGDYRTALGLLDPLRRERLPIRLALGNHDDRANLRAALGQGQVDKVTSVVEGAGIRFVILDSQDGVNVTAGRLGAAQLDWLARDLDSHPAIPSVVVVHHHLDARMKSALSDTEPLLAALRPRRQVKAIVFGHTHLWGRCEVDGLHLINLPAVGYAFGSRPPLGWVVLRPEPDGAEIELRCIGGNRREDGLRTWLTWRA